jgi:RimJ/RimL family protein N-acetyltransferase
MNRVPQSPVLETPQLRLWVLQLDDAAFIVELLNTEGWLRFIGDRGVRTLDDACGYLQRGPLAMQAQHGFSLYRVERRSGGSSIGLCGLIRREGLSDVDLGFAMLPRFAGQGLAHEASAAVLVHARQALGLARVVAIVAPENAASIGLLRKLGFGAEQPLRWGDATVLLFSKSM